MTLEMIVLIHSLTSAATGFMIFRGIEKVSITRCINAYDFLAFEFSIV